MSSLKYRMESWFLLGTKFLRRKYEASVCGHPTLKKGFVRAFDEEEICEMPLQENGNPDYCIDCIQEMAIQCVWCGKVIFIGDQVTLKIPRKEFKIPDYAIPFEHDPVIVGYVGCMRRSCADFLDVQGIWMPPGQVLRIPSPMEMLMNDNGDSALIVNDMSQYPKSAQKIPLCD